MNLIFLKVHWTWNDFILLDKIDNKDLNLDESLIKKMCDRHFWIWSDWILVVDSSDKADYKYIMYNSDWTEAEMCWNWIRCFMKYIFTKEKKDNISVETWNWILNLKYINWLVEVDMWPPLIFENKNIQSEDKNYEYTSVSMWNPHCVIFLDNKINLENFDIEKYWTPIENNKDYFPNRVNTEFVQVESENKWRLRVWERWCWETLSCWTWVCASVVAWIDLWHFAKWQDVSIDIKWWTLKINWSWNIKDPVIMKWPAEIVYKGIYTNK